MSKKCIPLIVPACAFLALAWVPAAPAPAGGDEIESLQRLSLEELMEVPVVSTTRGVHKLNEAPGIVTRLSREDIEVSGARSLLDLLKRLPGFQVNLYRSGAWMIWIRGVTSTTNDRVLLLVDGVPMRELVQGDWHPDESLSLLNIDHIEIIRGPGSALYGGNAYAGVISIFTAKKVRASRFSLMGGDLATAQCTVESGANRGNLHWTYAVNTFQTDGWRPERSMYGSPGDKKNSRDGFGFQSRLTLGEAWDFSFRQSDFDFSHGEFDYSRFRDYFNHYLTVSATHNWSFSRGSWKNRLYYFNDRYGFEEEDRKTDNSVKLRKRQRWWSGIFGLESQFTRAFGQGQTLTGGLSIERQQATYREEQWNPGTETPYFFNSWFSQNGEGPGENTVRTMVYAAYGQYEIAIPRFCLGLTLGGRLDRYEGFGNHFSPRLGVVFNPVRGTTVKALYGQAFRAPSNTQRFLCRSDGQIAGRPDLKPEIVDTWELEYTQKWGPLFFTRVDCFHSRYTDSIMTVNNKPWYNSPIPRIIDGIEVEAQAEYRASAFSLSAFANATFLLRACDETPAGHVDISSLARRMANVGATLRFGRWTVYAALNLVGRRNTPVAYDPDSGTVRYYYHTAVDSAYEEWKAVDNLGGYRVLDLSVTYRGGGKLNPTVEFTVRNALDEEYYNPSYDPDTYYDHRREPLNVGFRLSVSY